MTGDFAIKLVRNSFRVQLSANSIAICFASAQPKPRVSGGEDCLCLCRCLQSKSKSNSNHSGNLLGTCSHTHTAAM